MKVDVSELIKPPEDDDESKKLDAPLFLVEKTNFDEMALYVRVSFVPS